MSLVKVFLKINKQGGWKFFSPFYLEESQKASHNLMQWNALKTFIGNSTYVLSKQCIKHVLSKQGSIEDNSK